MKVSKALGVSLIVFINACALILVTLVGFEFCLENPEESYVHLYQTSYYDDPQKGNPYWSFAIQHIHPYYIFSLPWKKKDITSVNNNVASLAEDGFRKVKIKEGENKKIIFLGGSVAFGHYATSNKQTIGALLNKELPIQVVNRNAPSWNSHQEAIALYKYKDIENVVASISLYLANDISIICRERDVLMGEEPIDSPENWKILDKKKIKVRPSKPFSPLLSLKSLAYKIFPNIYTNLSKNKKEKRKHQDSVLKNCYENNLETVVAESFLFNQKQMSKMAKAYNFRHYLFIQPFFSQHIESGGYDKYSEQDISFVKKVIKYVVNSSYCKNNLCLDLSSAFDDRGLWMKKYNGEDDAVISKWLDSGIFKDEVHLNDKGNKIIAGKIIGVLKQKLILD